MGRHYTQLSLEERCTIARLREDGQSLAQIAATLGRQPSTVARELKRNSGSTAGYRPAYAQDLTAGRRWSGSRLVRDDALREQVLGYLGQGWSPEQVSGRLALQQVKQVISHESIYRFIYAQLIRANNGAWRLYLPRAKFKRGWRARAGLLEETGLAEIEFEGDGQRIRVTRGGAAVVVTGAAASPAGGPSLPLGAAAATASEGPPAGAVLSPMVGTAYAAPEPGAPPLVKAGDPVAKGQTLLIIEAMKVMNPIPAPHAGTVTEVLFADGRPATRRLRGRGQGASAGGQPPDQAGRRLAGHDGGPRHPGTNGPMSGDCPGIRRHPWPRHRWTWGPLLKFRFSVSGIPSWREPRTLDPGPVPPLRGALPCV